MMQQNLSLRQRLPKKTLGEVSTNTTAASNAEVQHSEYRRISPEYWSKAYRKDFHKFKIFFDGLEDKYSRPLERKIKLLGGRCEVFFGQQCTHVVTMKPFVDEILQSRFSVTATIPVVTSQQDQENVPAKPMTINSNDMKITFPKKPNAAMDPSQQLFFDNAHRLGIEVWSVSKMNYVVSALMNKPTTQASPTQRTTRHENLDKMLLDEKKYGVSTGHRNGQTSRPTYVTFNEQYIKVEDVAGVHRPILIKEYPTPTFDSGIPENDRIYPWPKLYVKQNVHARSPFTVPDAQQKSKKPTNPAAPMPSSKKHTPLQQQQEQQQIPVQTHSTMVMPPPGAANPNYNNTPTCMPPNTSTHQINNQNQQDQHEHVIQQHLQNDSRQNMNHENDTPTVASPSATFVNTSLRTQYTTPALQNFPSTHFTHPSKSTITTNMTHQITSNPPEKNAAFRRPGTPLYENMSRMDRRMVTNQRATGTGIETGRDGMATGAMKMNDIDHKSQSKRLASTAATGVGASYVGSTAVGGSRMVSLRPTVAAKTAHDQAERRKKDFARRMTKENSKYCENCVSYYQDLEKHLQEESHQTFVRDKNNFKELDMVLKSIQRIRR